MLWSSSRWPAQFSWRTVAEGVEVAGEEYSLQLAGQSAKVAQRGDRSRPTGDVGVHHRRDQVAREARLAGVAEDEPLLELVDRAVGESKLRDADDWIVELEEVEAAERRGVLVLLSAGDPELVLLELIGQPSDLVRC